MTLLSRTTVATFALAVCFSNTVAAQTTVAGQWQLRYSRASRPMHGADTTISERTAAMTLRPPRGDSVFGVWHDPPTPGDPPPAPRPIRGTIRRDSIRVQVDLPVHDDGFFAELGRDVVEFLKTHIHNSPTMIPLLEFTVRGDSLIGTRRTMERDGSSLTSPLPLAGSRERASRPPL
jgi:hypothetical protein